MKINKFCKLLCLIFITVSCSDVEVTPPRKNPKSLIDITYRGKKNKSEDDGQKNNNRTEILHDHNRTIKFDKGFEILEYGNTPSNEIVNVIKSNQKLSKINNNNYYKFVDINSRYYHKNKNNNFDPSLYSNNTKVTLIKINKPYINNNNEVNFFEVKPFINDKKNIERIFPNVNVLIPDKTLKPGNNNHATNVITSFADVNKNYELDSNELNDIKNINISLYDLTNWKKNASVKGIISMSYGYPESNLQMGRLGSKSDYFDKSNSVKFNPQSQYLSKVVTSSLYVFNEQLRIKSLGNSSFVINTNYFNNSLQNLYQTMSPELQKASRNDSIMVKNIISPEANELFNLKERNNYTRNIYTTINDDGSKSKYYEFQNQEQNDAKALLLRSFTIATDGIIEETGSRGNYGFGSSYAAPRIARIAYEVKKKFPFLTYNQVKQVILTTAKNDNSGYLNDYVGWGIADLEKALKGPAQFNAGLIEEQKYYLGESSKIFEDFNKNVENNLTYFYVDIPKNESYTFSNDITSGLKGDGTTNDYTEVLISGRDSYEDTTIRSYKYKIPKVLDSERKYYANVAEAGLRKFGLGTLTLEGKQLYNAPTQVVEGTLVLNNNSNSKYQILELGTLIIGDKSKNKTINIFNSITNDGIVEFNNNTNLVNYKASSKSLTRININNNTKLNLNSFESSGDIYLNFSKDVNLSSLKNIIRANKLDIDKSKFKNPFLHAIEIKNNVYDRVIDISVNGLYENAFKNLESLSTQELRNIPSYDDNAKQFYSSYKHLTKPFNFELYISGEYDPYDEESSNKTLTKDELTLLNYKADNINQAKDEIFNDNSGLLISNSLNQNMEIKDLNDRDILSDDNNKIINLKTEIYNTSNIIKDHKFTPMTSNTYGIYFKPQYNIFYDNLSINGLIGLNYTYGEFDNRFSNRNNEFKSILYSAGLGIKSKYNNAIASYNLFMNINDISANRYSQNNRIDSKFNTISINNSIGLGYNFKVNDKLTITPYIDYTNSYTKIFNFKESGVDDNLKIDISNNSFTKHNISLQSKLDYKVDKYTTVSSKAKLDFNINPNNKLNIKTLGLQYQSNIKSNYKYKAEIDLFVEHKLKNDNIISVGASVNTNNKYSLRFAYNLGL